jgi:thymidylate synthase ThyX
MSFKVRIVGDTVHPQVRTARITTFEIYDPRYILAEWNTHGLLAKSAQSSRAVPVQKRIEALFEDAYVPKAFGKNKPGMQADENLDEVANEAALKIWHAAMTDAIVHARALADIGVHKQFANRIIEPYSHCYHIVTATEWDNFFRLRNSKMAQPEFAEVAAMMHEALSKATPRVGHTHLPYLEEKMIADPKAYKLYDGELHLISAARCARVSYQNHDGTEFDAEKDKELAHRLSSEGHMSPFDHPAYTDSVIATPDFKAMWAQPKLHGRYWGWLPVRLTIELANGMPPTRRDSFKVLELEDFV